VRDSFRQNRFLSFKQDQTVFFSNSYSVPTRHILEPCVLRASIFGNHVSGDKGYVDFKYGRFLITCSESCGEG
jgi:hypothetical protein